MERVVKVDIRYNPHGQMDEGEKRERKYAVLKPNYLLVHCCATAKKASG